MQPRRPGLNTIPATVTSLCPSSRRLDRVQCGIVVLPCSTDGLDLHVRGLFAQDRGEQRRREDAGRWRSARPAGWPNESWTGATPSPRQRAPDADDDTSTLFAEKCSLVLLAEDPLSVGFVKPASRLFVTPDCRRYVQALHYVSRHRRRRWFLLPAQKKGLTPLQ